MLSIDIQFMLDEEKLQFFRWCPSGHDTMADTVIAMCVQNR